MYCKDCKYHNHSWAMSVDIELCISHWAMREQERLHDILDRHRFNVALKGSPKIEGTEDDK